MTDLSLNLIFVQLRKVDTLVLDANFQQVKSFIKPLTKPIVFIWYFFAVVNKNPKSGHCLVSYDYFDPHVGVELPIDKIHSTRYL